MAKKTKGEREKPMTREMMDIMNAKLFAFMEEQQFGSLEEINEFLNKNVNGRRIDDVIPKKKGRKTNTERSDDLMYKAYESDPADGLKLANKALDYNPENIRAIIYIAENMSDVEEAVELYKQAIDIGARQLGEDFIKKNKGHFWGIHETRPYMTAKLGYAQCLELMNKTTAAIKEYSEILNLNPDDNQGVRYILAGLYLYSDRYDHYFKLYQKYKDDVSAAWLFNYALYLFATQGPSKKANAALAKANKSNRHVLLFMTGNKNIETEPEGYYSPGDEQEAIYYLMDNFKIWIKLSDSNDWVHDFLHTDIRLN